jgi:hypothetical protein
LTLASHCRPIPDDGEINIALYNAELENNKKNGRGTWFTGSWLYNEAYLSVVLFL